MNLFKTTIIVASLAVTQLSAEGEHSHDFPKEIMAFHHAMAPLWHMDKGAERRKLSCEATDKMLSLTSAIKDSGGLSDAVNAMKKTCTTKGSDIQSAFKKVHDAFHVVSDGAKK